MLTQEQINNGAVFVLKLCDVVGAPCYWAETLRGDTARRWYRIFLECDWNALREDAAAVFRNPVSPLEARRLLEHNRCVLLHTMMIEAGELIPAPASC